MTSHRFIIKEMGLVFLLILLLLLLGSGTEGDDVL